MAVGGQRAANHDRSGGAIEVDAGSPSHVIQAVAGTGGLDGRRPHSAISMDFDWLLRGGGLDVPAAVPVPLAPGICVANDDGKAFLGWRNRVDHDAAAEPRHAELSVAFRHRRGDAPRVGRVGAPRQRRERLGTGRWPSRRSDAGRTMWSWWTSGLLSLEATRTARLYIRGTGDVQAIERLRRWPAQPAFLQNQQVPSCPRAR